MKGLDRRSDRPPYRQIADHLHDDIESGVLEPGDRLPSERELAEHYDVERATAHRAVRELHLAGLVVAYPGRGVFVREPVTTRRLLMDPRIDPQMSFQLGDPEDNEPTSRDTLMGGGSWDPVPADVAAVFDIEPGEDMFSYFWTIHDRNGTFVIQGTTYYRTSLVEAYPRLMEDEPEAALGWYDMLQERYEIVLRHEDVVSARMPTPDESRRMDLDSGIPLITVLRISTDEESGDPMEVQRLLLPASRNELRYLV